MNEKDFKTQVQNYIKFLSNQPKGFIYKETKSKQNENNIIEKSLENKNDENPQILLDKIKSKYKDCQKCPLAKQGRSQVVFGMGNPYAKLMFVGEGPGRDEDKLGIPFVGRAGQLLTKIIEAMKLTREDVYISNVVKCRPPNNRTPLPNESDICKNLILFKEIEIIKPKIICALGATAAQGLLGYNTNISKTRGIFFQFNNSLVLPTYHPAYLLRNPDAKKIVWEDMKKIVEKLKSC